MFFRRIGTIFPNAFFVLVIALTVGSVLKAQYLSTWKVVGTVMEDKTAVPNLFAEVDIDVEEIIFVLVSGDVFKRKYSTELQANHIDLIISDDSNLHPPEIDFIDIIYVENEDMFVEYFDSDYNHYKVKFNKTQE